MNDIILWVFYYLFKLCIKYIFIISIFDIFYYYIIYYFLIEIIY